MSDSKACSKCGNDFPLSGFYVRRASSDGLTSACKKCVKAGVQRNYSRNHETILHKQAEHRRANPDHYRAKNAASHVKHREKRLARAMERRADPDYAERARAATEAWRINNPDLYAESQRRYREGHQEERSARLKRWMRENPAAVKAMRSRREARLRGAACVPFTPAQLAARVAVFGGRCWMCRGPYQHLDHVKPISKGGSHMLANLRPACASCNASKRDKWHGPSWASTLRR